MDKWDSSGEEKVGVQKAGQAAKIALVKVQSLTENFRYDQICMKTVKIKSITLGRKIIAK